MEVALDLKQKDGLEFHYLTIFIDGGHFDSPNWQAF
jgi:hypothetical protein